MPIVHGVTATEDSSAIRPIATVQSNVIGFVGFADDADAAAFPVNTAVLITDPLSAVADAGVAGNLASTLTAIAAHGKASVVVVRVAEGADATELETNIVGGSVDGNYTGMQALLSAPTQLGVTPRILGVPGNDTQAVTTALVLVAQQLGGFVYASAWGADTKEDAVTYRDNFSDRELMILWPDFKNGANSVPAVAMALGLRAKIDAEQGWHKTLSNVPVSGVTGTTKDTSEEVAAHLNENEITALIRRTGFRFWGNRTCSAEPLFAFESAVRTAQVLIDTMKNAHDWAIDKPLSSSLPQDILEGINAKLRGMVAAGQLIGGQAWIDPAKNTASDIAAGKLLVEYDYTPVPPLENLALTQKITTDYLIDFSESLAA